MTKSFDFVELSHRTASGKFYGEHVPRLTFISRVSRAIEALEGLDEIKKLVFYGEDQAKGRVSLNSTRSPQSNIWELVQKLIGQGFSEAEAQNIIHGIIGIATEAGELLEALAKVMTGEKFDRTNLLEEVGDVKWYMALLARAAPFEWGEDEHRVIEKLRARFPNAFTEHAANNRDLELERRVLEGGQPLAALPAAAPAFASPVGTLTINGEIVGKVIAVSLSFDPAGVAALEKYSAEG